MLTLKNFTISILNYLILNQVTENEESADNQNLVFLNDGYYDNYYGDAWFRSLSGPRTLMEVPKFSVNLSRRTWPTPTRRPRPTALTSPRDNSVAPFSVAAVLPIQSRSSSFFWLLKSQLLI